MSLPVGPILARSLYMHENRGFWETDVLARDLYACENIGLQETDVISRATYVHENVQIQELDVLLRVLSIVETKRDGEVFPWLMRISPTEQVRGGQVDLYGDGFGEVVDVAPTATATASTTSGGLVPANAINGTILEWAATDGATAWLRLTFPGARNVIAVTLEDRDGGTHRWGVPEFRFSDGGANINGGVAVELPVSTTEIPLGAARTHYVLPAPRDTTYVEIRVASGGAGANRGLREVWVWTDTDQAAESSTVISNEGLPDEVSMGIVSWSGRSPGLWPANGGQPVTKAATVTVPSTAESGLVIVEEAT